VPVSLYSSPAYQGHLRMVWTVHMIDRWCLYKVLHNHFPMHYISHNWLIVAYWHFPKVVVPHHYSMDYDTNWICGMTFARNDKTTVPSWPTANVQLLLLFSQRQFNYSWWRNIVGWRCVDSARRSWLDIMKTFEELLDDWTVAFYSSLNPAINYTCLSKTVHIVSH
jgi:hypothetical protein